MGLRETILQQFKGEPAMKKPAETAICAGTVSVLERLGRNRIKFSGVRKDLAPAIVQLVQAQQVHFNQRREQLEAARSTKEFLASRIELMQDKIQALQPPVAKQSRSPKLSPDTLRVYRKEQLLREEKRKAFLQAQEEQRQQEETEAELKKQALAEQRAQEKQRRLHELQQKRAERESKLEEAREAARRGVSEKPLFQYMAEDYDRRALQLEAERRYEPLSRRSKARATPSEYFRPRDRTVQVTSERVAVPRRVQAILERDRETKEENQRKAELRRVLAERQKQYGSLVKEMYVPDFDRLKAKEMEFIKEKLTQPVVKKVYFGSTSEYRSSSRKPRLPEPYKSESKVLRDYLQDLRAQREEREHRLLKSLESIHFKHPKEIQKAEATALRQETVLRRAAKSSCFDPAKVDAETSLSQLLLSSVRAKAAMLLNT